MELSNSAPVVFIQYLAAIAIVEGIQTYARGYKDLPVKLKWPNDICKLEFFWICKFG
jgi:biotin--protein ligase